MCKIGLSSCAFELTEENFKKLNESGIEAIEVSVSLSRQSTINHKELSVFSKRYNIDLWSYHLPFMPFQEIDISSADSAIRTKTIEFFTQLIKKAADVGIQNFVIHPSGEPIPDQMRDQRLKCAMESLDKLAEVAYKENAVIAVEDLPRTCLGNTADEMLKLISANEKLRVCFDSNHLLKDNNLNFIEKIAEKIVTVHISDYDFIDEKHWLPGEGLVNWNEVYSMLKKVGYSGAWLYEIGLKSPKTLPRSRDLTFDDFVRNAHDIFTNTPIKRII